MLTDVEYRYTEVYFCRQKRNGGGPGDASDKASTWRYNGRNEGHDIFRSQLVHLLTFEYRSVCASVLLNDAHIAILLHSPLEGIVLNLSRPMLHILAIGSMDDGAAEVHYVRIDVSANIDDMKGGH